MKLNLNLSNILSAVESPIASIVMNKVLGSEAGSVLGLIDDYAAIKAVQGSGQSADVITQQVAAVAADAVGQIASAVHLNANLQRNPSAAPTQVEGVNEMLLLGAKQIAAEYATQSVTAQLAKVAGQPQGVAPSNVANLVEQKIDSQAEQQQQEETEGAEGAEQGKSGAA